MSKQTAEKKLCKRIVNNNSVDDMVEVLAELKEYAESYHTQKLREMEDELGERVVYYNEKYQKHMKGNNHASASGAWHKAQGIKEVLQLISKAKD